MLNAYNFCYWFESGTLTSHQGYFFFLFYLIHFPIYCYNKVLLYQTHASSCHIRGWGESGDFQERSRSMNNFTTFLLGWCKGDTNCLLHLLFHHSSSLHFFNQGDVREIITNFCTRILRC